MDAAQILRKEVKNIANKTGLSDARLPSKMFCKVSIKALANLTGVSDVWLTDTIEKRYNIARGIVEEPNEQ